MLDALMSHLPEDSIAIHTTETNFTGPSHSKSSDKNTCNTVIVVDGNMPLNNSYCRVSEHPFFDAEHSRGNDLRSQELDLLASNTNKLASVTGSEELEQIHANGYLPGKNYDLPTQESENSVDSLVFMLDGVKTATSLSQPSSTEFLSVMISDCGVLMHSASCKVNDECQNIPVVDDQIGLVDNETNHAVTVADSNDANAESSAISTDVRKGEVAALCRRSNSSDEWEPSTDAAAPSETTSNFSAPKTNSLPCCELIEQRPHKSSDEELEKTKENASTDESLSSTGGASEAPNTGDHSVRPISESVSSTVSGGELKSPLVGIRDQLVESILRQIDDEDGESVVLRRKESRPNNVRLSAASLSGQGIAGCVTPIGRTSNFVGIGDDVDIDETQFVEINLQSYNSDNRLATERSASGDLSSLSSFASKTSRLGNFLVRNFTLKKSREREDDDSSSDVLGWKLFGRVPPKQAPEGGLADIINEHRTKGFPKLAADKDLAVRRSDKEVPSTTALILQPRPSGLPTKDPEEELKHKLMYDGMVEGARRSEQKEAKLKKKQREQQIRYEEELSAAVKIWNTEILPCWETAKNSKRTQDLWWKGIPPSIRGKVWKLAIGNDLNVTAELYEICLVRAREKLKILRDVVAAGSDTDSLSSFSIEANGNRESSVDLIELDVSRTFPQLCIFQAGGPYHKLLQGLLGAYVCYRPDVGYVQGMSFLAAVLLLNMDDVNSFVCFANLLNKPCEVAFFRLNENLMKAYFDTYQVFLKENLPKLYAHFGAQHITPDLYIIDWMYTLFAKSLPLDVASRVWDVFCRDGEEFLFRTALGILRLYEDILLNLDFIHLAQFLTRLPENISGFELFQCIGQIRMQINKCSFAQVFAKNQCP